MFEKIFYNELLHPFGFHGQKISSKGFLDGIDNCNGIDNCTGWNCSIVAGWIPGIGQIAGIIHFCIGLKNKSASLIGRGIIEVFGFGFFLFVVDMIVTLGRYIATRLSLRQNSYRSISSIEV